MNRIISSEDSGSLNVQENCIGSDIVMAESSEKLRGGEKSCTQSVRDKTRINYIDAVRGFVMFIVVFQHVRAFGFNLYGGDGILSFIYMYFFLSTFFLISGFVGHKVVKTDSLTGLNGFIIRKFVSLIVPTAVFLLIYDIVAYKNPGMEIWGFPGGYWFTYSLFLISVVFAAMSVAMKGLGIKNGLIISICVGLMLESVRILFPDAIDTGLLYHLRARQFCSYFLFYVIGISLYTYRDKVFSALEKNWVKGFVIGGTFFLLIVMYSFGDILPGIVCGGLDFVISILSSIAVFMLFYLTREYWNSGSRVSLWLRKIGQHSIEIYMLHYFFIPAAPMLGVYFKSADNAVIELAVVGSLSIIVISICMLMSRILAMAGPVGKMIFGK